MKETKTDFFNRTFWNGNTNSVSFKTGKDTYKTLTIDEARAYLDTLQDEE